MLVLRTDLSGTPSFRELLGRVRTITLEAYLHQELPFEYLVEALQPERSLSYNPLFQVAFALEQAAPTRFETAGVTWQVETLPEVSAKFDLQLTIREGQEGLCGLFVYNRDLFEAATIERMGGHWLTMLSAMVAHPDDPVATAPLLTQAERQRILVDWKGSEIPNAPVQCVPQLVEAQAAHTPEALAVADERTRLPYQALNQRANQLAHHLRTLGVGPNVLVGVCLERSVDLVVALLGVLKAGGAYVPLDPAYPASRLAFMVQDAQAPVLITRQQWASSFSPVGTQAVCLDRDALALAQQPDTDLPERAGLTDLAYVLYTSGSTGQPKGVQITHEGLLNLISWHQHAFEVTAADRATQIASPAFDATGWELWPYLAAGASVHVIDEETRVTPEALRDWLLRQEITISFLPTPLAEAVMMLEWPLKTTLRALLTGGDALQHYPAASLPFALINNYGPTESTVVATSGQVLPLEHPERPPAIGRPIANIQVYILDPHLQLAPIGVPGELYIGGMGLARGYHHRPDLTAEKFIPHPYSSDRQARLYRTGDEARWRADGTIEFLGRLDHQVKIRGFRIELGEVETLLGQHPSIRDAVVLAREDTPGEKRLVAYLVAAAGETPEGGTLGDFLRAQLPAYMLPAAYVFLDALPLSPNGKLDRQALPPPEPSAVEARSKWPPTPDADRTAAGRRLGRGPAGRAGRPPRQFLCLGWALPPGDPAGRQAIGRTGRQAQHHLAVLVSHHCSNGCRP